MLETKEKKIFEQKTFFTLEEFIPLFKNVLMKKLLFNACFIGLIAFEFIYFVIYLSFFIYTFTLAIHLSLLFATFFFYLALRIYVSTYIEQKILLLFNQFTLKIKEISKNFEDGPTHHILVADVYCQLASQIDGIEKKILYSPFHLKNIDNLIQKFSEWYFWRETHDLKENLLEACVGQYIQLVRISPTDLDAHAGLANAYVMLSGLYVNFQSSKQQVKQFYGQLKYPEEFQKKFQFAAKQAIEEFKILRDYAPNDPWVHVQLAYSYHDLQMPEEEIKEYECILQICPDDKETLYKLGRLYFQQGQNAKGLNAYESLKSSHYKKAEDLIHFYGAYAVLNES